MKNIFICALGLAVLTSSCDLSREPKTSLSRENAMKTIDDATNWHAGLIQRLRVSYGGNYILPQDIQADELTATLNYGNRLGSFADWSLLQDQTREVRDVYAGYYRNIKNANIILRDMPQLLGAQSELNEKNKQTITHYLGEAYFTRAYSYLMLALRFGKAYNEATASQDLSVPLFREYDYQQKPPRATNKEVYDFILEDLNEAAKKLADVNGKANTNELTIDAVKALKARTYLYMGKYQDALSAANELIASSTYALMSPSKQNMEQMWFADGTQLKEAIFMPTVSFPDEPNNVVDEYLEPQANTSSFKPTYIPSKEMYDLYDAEDTRKTVYFWAGETLNIDGTNYNDLVMVGKWRGNPEYATTDNAKWGKVPNGRLRPKVLRIAEQYLIAAEAAYKLGQDALTPLNALRTSRGLSPEASVGEALWQAIQDERQRELAFEGFRLFDLRRWGKDVVRNTPQMTSVGTKPIVEQVSKGVRYTAGHDKFVWPIPQQDVRVGHLIQNPGY